MAWSICDVNRMDAGPDSAGPEKTRPARPRARGGVARCELITQGRLGNDRFAHVGWTDAKGLTSGNARLWS